LRKATVNCTGSGKAPLRTPYLGALMAPLFASLLAGLFSGLVLLARLA